MSEERTRGAESRTGGPSRPPRPTDGSGESALAGRVPGRAGAVVTRTTGPVPAVLPAVTAPVGEHASGRGPSGTETPAATDEDVGAQDVGSHDDGSHHDHLYDDFDEDGDDYVDLPPDGRLPRWAGVLLVFVLLITVVVGASAWWYRRQINPPGNPGATVSVSIPRGSSLSGIGSILSREGIVPNGIVFNFYSTRKDAGPFEAGVYELKKNSDIDLVLDTMAKGPTGELQSAEEVIRVSIPEGLTVEAIVARVAGQVTRFDVDLLEAALADGKVESPLRPKGQDSYEGLLFPATYEISGTETELDFLDKLASEMETRVERNGVDAARARIEAQFGIDVSEYELLIVASLVQAEAGNAEEAPKIATAIYNRLKADSTALTLGIDAVDDYGAALAGTDVGSFRDEPRPYNTRLVKGLPPTPISAPGDYALNAAFTPAEGPWTYYVLTDPGVHSFTADYDEFLALKKECKAKDLGCG